MNKYIVSFITLFLIGCGGGSSSSSNDSIPSTPTNTSSVDIDATFSGLRTSATLNPSLAREVASDVLFFEDFIINLFLANSFVSNEELINENLNESEACPSGGNINLSIRNVNSIGISEFTFDDCIIEGATINGGYIFEYDFNTTLLELELRNYRVSNQVDQSILFNGTVDQNDNQTLITNLLRESGPEQLLVKDLVLDVPFLNRREGELPIFSGEFFYSDSGKVDLNINRRFTSNTLPVDYFSEGALLNVSDSQGNSSSFQFINSEGEPLGSSSANVFGINDENAVIEINFLSEENSPSFGRVTLGNLLTVPAIGLAPISNEVLSANNQPIQFSNNREINSLENGLTFDGRNSSDPEGALLTYNWAIIEAPTGSNAQFNSTNAISPTLSIDYLGVYKVEMIVSDGTLLSDPKIITVEVGGPQFNPLESFGGLSWNARQLDGSFSEGPTFNPITTLDIDVIPNSNEIPDFLQFDVEWNITDQPSSTAVDLLEIDSRVSRFTPKQEGQYTLEAIANNGFSTFRDTITIDILDFDRSVTPRLNGRFVRQNASVGVEQELELRYLVEVGSNEYTSSIEIIEQPLDSNPQLELISNQLTSNSEALFKYEFDKAGRYIFNITTRNDRFDSEPLQLVFNAFDLTNAPFTEDTTSSTFTSSGQSLIERVEIGDIDQDGFNDIILIYSFQYQILYGQPDNSFVESPQFVIPSVNNQVGSLIDLIDVNNDSRLELVFRHFPGSIATVMPLSESQIPVDEFNEQPLGDMPIIFDNSFFVHSFSDINNDGLKDIILTRKPNIFNNETFDGVAYSLQVERNFYASPVSITTSIKNITKVSHDEVNNSLLIVSDDSDDSSSFSGDDFSQTVANVDEYKFQSAGFTLVSSNKINYASEVLFGSHIEVNHIVDLDKDGVKELIADVVTSGNFNTLILKNDSLNNSYEINQTIVSPTTVSSFDLFFEDMDLDGDLDIAGLGRILYQDENNQFNSTRIIERDTSRDLLPIIYDIDNDNDFDLFTIHRFFSGDQVPNIRVLRNTTN